MPITLSAEVKRSGRRGGNAAVRHGTATPERVVGNSQSATGEDGIVCSFDGTYLEVDPPFRTEETWLFDGWPDAEAAETWQLHETDEVTTVTMTLAFRDKAGRDHYPASPQDVDELASSNGLLASFEALEDILSSLLDPNHA